VSDVVLDRSCPICCGNAWSLVFEYTAPPAGEPRYDFTSRGEYRRTIYGCECCGHMISVHRMDDESLYTGEYNTSTYGADDGLLRGFERIINLDPSNSDNVGRARRIDEFAAKHGLPGGHRTVLDVGTGLCVFLHQMKKGGWDGTALDPDPRAVAHARDRVGVSAVCGDFRTAEGLGTYSLVTFNKVLEHVPNPIEMLAHSRQFVAPGGYVYVELPDGEVAAVHGSHREEFFVDHHHAFSFASLAMLAARAGFTVVEMERLQEPSTKFTLRAFVTPAGGGA
jgi:SAM-dependent methyltransferase